MRRFDLGKLIVAKRCPGLQIAAVGRRGDLSDGILAVHDIDKVSLRLGHTVLDLNYLDPHIAGAVGLLRDIVTAVAAGPKSEVHCGIQAGNIDIRLRFNLLLDHNDLDWKEEVVVAEIVVHCAVQDVALGHFTLIIGLGGADVKVTALAVADLFVVGKNGVVARRAHVRGEGAVSLRHLGKGLLFAGQIVGHHQWGQALSILLESVDLAREDEGALEKNTGIVAGILCLINGAGFAVNAALARVAGIDGELGAVGIGLDCGGVRNGNALCRLVVRAGANARGAPAAHRQHRSVGDGHGGIRLNKVLGAFSACRTGVSGADARATALVFLVGGAAPGFDNAVADGDFHLVRADTGANARAAFIAAVGCHRTSGDLDGRTVASDCSVASATASIRVVIRCRAGADTRCRAAAVSVDNGRAANRDCAVAEITAADARAAVVPAAHLGVCTVCRDIAARNSNLGIRILTAANTCAGEVGIVCIEGTRKDGTACDGHVCIIIARPFISSVTAVSAAAVATADARVTLGVHCAAIDNNHSAVTVITSADTGSYIIGARCNRTSVDRDDPPR